MSALLNEVLSAEFDFNETVVATANVDDSVAFETGLVVVVVDGSVEGFGVDAQIADR